MPWSWSGDLECRKWNWGLSKRRKGHNLPLALLPTHSILIKSRNTCKHWKVANRKTSVLFNGTGRMSRLPFIDLETYEYQLSRTQGEDIESLVWHPDWKPGDRKGQIWAVHQRWIPDNKLSSQTYPLSTEMIQPCQMPVDPEEWRCAIEGFKRLSQEQHIKPHRSLSTKIEASGSS